MALPESRKAEATLALAAAIATAAGNAQMTHAAYLAADRVEPVPGGTQAPLLWEGLALDGVRGAAEAILSSSTGFRRQGLRFFLSDLLFPADPMPVVSRLAGDAATLVVVQVLARQDAEPPARGNLRLTDAETGQARDVFIDAAAQQRYRRRLMEHRAAWDAACRRVGATLLPVIAEDLLESWDWRAFMEHDVVEAA